MVEILCTVTGILAGSAAVATIMHQQAERDHSQFESISTQEESLRLKRFAEQLELLTHRMTADVAAHSERVSHINERLVVTDQQSGPVISAINDLIAANTTMQNQLADAQHQIHEQSRQIEATVTEARTDALTGLANRRALNEHLHGCIQSQKSNEVSALLMIDIDHFKSCNDTHGHLAGDAVLTMFAKRIAQWSGNKSYTARFGGEEFAVVLHGSSFEEITTQAASLRSALSEKVITYLDLGLKLTASAGLTQLRSGESIEAAYHRADEGLYIAKHNGRNCGYFLTENDWVRFSEDKPACESEATSFLHPSLQFETANVKLRGLPFADSQFSSTAAARSIPPLENASAGTRRSQLSIAMEGFNLPSKSGTDETTADVLDLNDFLHRLEVHFTQLSRGDLPATAIMLDAVGLDQLQTQLGERCWANTLGIIQQQVRGIDVICRINQHTICIFMPGSKLEAAIDQAVGMQKLLATTRREMLHVGPVPDRFCIALASVLRNENAGTYMQRLERALGDALKAQPGELIIHDGNSLIKQTV